MKKITSLAEISYQILLEAWLKSAQNSLRERRYNIASVLIFRSDPYSELLKESQQVVWLH